MSLNNRRKFTRLRIDKFVKVPVQIFPVIPFIGETIEADSVDISAGGMALRILNSLEYQELRKGSKIKIHFRLPGHTLQECTGKVVSHRFGKNETHCHMGIRFMKISKKLLSELQHMAMDNDSCDNRVQTQKNPWCLPTCTFFNLCRKPIKPKNEINAKLERFEISFQAL